MSSKISDQRAKAMLLSVLRRYMMEHLKGSSARASCLCSVCVEARRVLEKIAE